MKFEQGKPAQSMAQRNNESKLPQPIKEEKEMLLS
jgi:hypothetical protein